MYGLLIKLALAAALLAGFGFWCWTGGAASVKKDFDAAKAEWKAIELTRENVAARDSVRRTEANIGVTDAHNKRVAKLAATAADARSELGKLLDTISANRAEAAATGQGVDDSPTASELLGQCSERYTEVARVADSAIAQVIGLQAYSNDVCR